MSLQFLFFESNITWFYFSVVFLSVAFCCNCQQLTPRVSTFCFRRVPGVGDILNNSWRDPKTEDRTWWRGNHVQITLKIIKKYKANEQRYQKQTLSMWWTLCSTWCERENLNLAPCTATHMVSHIIMWHAAHWENILLKIWVKQHLCFSWIISGGICRWLAFLGEVLHKKYLCGQYGKYRFNLVTCLKLSLLYLLHPIATFFGMWIVFFVFKQLGCLTSSLIFIFIARLLYYQWASAGFPKW